jgi:GAF domain-containing protein
MHGDAGFSPQVTNIALKLQAELLKNSISFAQSINGNLILKATLKSVLSTFVEVTGADRGSIFLIDEDSKIVESILSRGPVTRDVKSETIAKVLDDGLAGWTIRHRAIGTISDTMTDDRWVQLPNQPYTVRSAISVPLIYGIDLIGILTLTHAQPHHFSLANVCLMEFMLEYLAFLIVNAQLHATYKLSELA